MRRPSLSWLRAGLRHARTSGHQLRLDLAMGRFALSDRRSLEAARSRFGWLYTPERDPLVSVVIATYNRGSLLCERTLPAVLAQTYRKLEIVIVGDACTDDTAERIARIADPRVRFFNLAERGRYPLDPQKRWQVAGSVPANWCMELARGEWFAYLDDDDVFTPDHVEVLLDEARRCPEVELIWAQYRREVTSGVWETAGGACFPDGRRPFGKANVPHSTVFFRSYLRMFRFREDAWRYGIPTDNLTWQRMGRAGVRTTHLPRVVMSSPLRPGQLHYKATRGAV